MFLRKSKVVLPQKCSYIYPCYKSTSSPITADPDGGTLSSTLPRPFDKIPGPKGLPFLGSYWDYLKPGGFRFDKYFEAIDKRFKEYGPIYKENLFGNVAVTVTDLEEYMKVIRIDGKYPVRELIRPLYHYKKIRGERQSILNKTGSEWSEERQIMSMKLLRPFDIIQHIGGVDEVTNDFLNHLPTGLKSQYGPLPDENGKSFVRSDFKENLFLWTLEAIGEILFGTRLGCFESVRSELANKYLKHVSGFFSGLQPLLFDFPYYVFYPTKNWKLFEESYSGLREAGLEIIKQQKSMLHSKADTNSPNLLSYFISQNMEPELIAHILLDILGGAIDTTTTTTLWCLYCLGKYESAQEKLYKETIKYLPNEDDKVTAEIVNDLKYVKAFLKETLRFYPVAFLVSRLISDKIEVCGYELPAGTNVRVNLYSMSRSPKYHDDPEVFRPERWIRDGGALNQLINTMASLPFGHGARMCIGRRLAEMEIYVFLTNFVRKYKIEWIGETEVQPIVNTMLTPDRPLKFRLTPRN